MIHNEIISSKNIPDEYHHRVVKLVEEMFECLCILAEREEYRDPRLFLNSLLLVHAEMLAVLMYSARDEIDMEEYLSAEMDGFLKNFRNIYKEYEEKGED
jgi:hypothetical protein